MSCAGLMLRRKRAEVPDVLDHKIPISKGGTYDIENLQILTWFENRAKCDMTQEEWEKFKNKTNTESAYFV